ncbi:hypothetical protein E8E13_010523 [Curvularia kusanoi]|uniref:Apple domain-containing protein n=1 Tax=Curvularia kusanoi TaxID=90978 RepID=A0A9P4WET7_CURKU|nr:hypothetical protein E8E13_010523 [Curvularia kusanoi]
MAPLLQAMALALRASAPICPAAPTCPQDDQCDYSSNGVVLQVACSTDYYGGDLQLVQSATLQDCLQACAANSQCVALSYTGQNCYLKSSLESGQSNANVIGGAVLSRPTATASSAASTSTAAATTTVAVTTTFASTTTVASTTSVASAAPTACPATYTCPENNGCLLSGSNSQIYQVTCGTDYYGGDLPSQSTDSFEDCAKACANNSQCVAASFVGGKGAGTCYLKSSNNGPTINSNVDSIELYTAPAPVSSSAVASSAAVSSAAASSAAASSAAASSAAASSAAASSAAASSAAASSPSTASAATSTPAPISKPAPISTPAPVSTPAPAPTQVIVNGGFESSDMSPWTIGGIGYSSSTGRSTVNPRTGKYSFQAQGMLFAISPFSVTLSQTVSVVPGKAYNLALSTKQNVPSCMFSGFYNEVPIFANVKFTGTNYATTTAQIPSLSTLSKNGVLRISATGCFGTSVWFDDISLTQA